MALKDILVHLDTAPRCAVRLERRPAWRCRTAHI